MNIPVIFRFDELESTNQYVKQHLETLPDKAIVIATRQTKGKGRLEHTWLSSNPKNIYFTILCKLQISDPSCLSILTHYLALTSAKILDSYLQGTIWEVQIKWPNDLYISRYKIGGILAEAVWINNQIKGLALGIGINLDLNLEECQLIDQPASSMQNFSNESLDKEIIIQQIITAFFKDYEICLRVGFSFIQKEYNKKLIKEMDSIFYQLQNDGSMMIQKKGKKIRVLLNPIEND